MGETITRPRPKGPRPEPVLTEQQAKEVIEGLHAYEAEQDMEKQDIKEILDPKTPAAAPAGADQNYQAIRQQFAIMRRKQALRIIQVLNQAGYNARVPQAAIDAGNMEILTVEVQV